LKLLLYQKNHPRCICNFCDHMAEHAYIIKRHTMRHTQVGCKCDVCGKVYKVSFVCFCSKRSRPVSSTGRALDCESGHLGSIPWQRLTLSFGLIMKFFLRSFTLYLCSGMYRSNQFLAKVKATRTDELCGSLSWSVVKTSNTYTTLYWEV
jgi:hypothetical protein